MYVFMYICTCVLGHAKCGLQLCGCWGFFVNLQLRRFERGSLTEFGWCLAEQQVPETHLSPPYFWDYSYMSSCPTLHVDTHNRAQVLTLAKQVLYPPNHPPAAQTIRCKPTSNCPVDYE